MKVNRNSWHYKLANTSSFDKHKSLCSYFWNVVWALLFMTVFFGAVLWCFVVMPILGFMEVGIFTPFSGMVPWLILVTVSTFALSISAIKSCIDNRTPSEKSPGLLRSYYLAVKGKVCPLIEYYDGEEMK